MQAEDFKDGQILVVNKPLGWTSFQVVNKIRWLIRKRFDLKKIKVGHAGTLDPLATGVLVICTGKFTKKIETLQSESKVYTGTITLGATTPSYDLETEIDQTYPIQHISEKNLFETCREFTGKIKQIPPIFSAIKKDGVRLYEKARKGEQVEIKAREVDIFSFDLTKIDLPIVEFRIHCSKGTYIRSIAHDFGKALKSGGHLSSLKRTKSGSFDLNQATTIEEFEKMLNQSPNS